MEQTMNILTAPIGDSLSSTLCEGHPEGGGAHLSFGASLIDQRLQGRMPRAALHEIFSAKSEDIASSSAFAVMLMLRLGEADRPTVWIAEEKVRIRSGRLYPPGLVALGGNPDAMVLVETGNAKDALRASADAIRSGAAGAVILSVYGNAPLIDLTATRRLMLAASSAGVLALLLRFDATPVASAAYSRWQIVSVPSRPLAANAPGFTAFDVALTRHRGGVAPFKMRLEWNHEKRAFKDSPLSGGLSALASGGAAGTPERQSA
jgi:protein ImuA